MIKVRDGYAKLVGTTASGSASHILLSNGGVKAVSDFALADGTGASGTWGISITGNAGSATYATNSTYLYASDSPYRYGDSAPYYMRMRYNINGDNRWYLSAYPETPKTVAVDYAYSAGSVDWGNITGKPSSFTPSSHTHTYIESKANYTFTSSTLPNSFDWGVSAGFVADNAGYGSYGSVLTVRTYTGGGGTLQLYAPYSKTYGGERLKARFGNYDSNVGNSWTTLKEIAWTSDIPNPTNYYWANVKVSASSNAATYPTFANMKSTGRVYLNEWIEFSGNTGLYWPNTHGAHFYPNDTSTYGQFKLLGNKGSYSGIHFGNSTSYLTVMSTDTHHGLYCENTGQWEFYYNRTNKQAGILTSSLTSGHALTVGGNISVIYNSYPGLTIHNNTTSGEASMYLKNNTAGWALGVNTWGVGAGSFGLGQYSGTGSSNCRLSIDNNGKVRIGTTSGNEMLNVGGWIGTVGNTGWYSCTHAGGWYMSDANWIRSYNSKPLCIDIGTNNTYGIGTHRLAAYFYGSGHVSILLSNNVCGWGICSNQDTNLYFGYRPSSSASTTTNDNYPSYLNKAGHWYASHYYESSDERLKDFGKDIEVDLDYIKQIPKKYFTFKKNPDKLEIGTSAQVIQQKYPEIVNENNEGTLVLDYSKLSIIALKGIDNLYDLILHLQEENKELRDEINNLKTNKLWQS